jgi:hypothetical protein
MSLSNQSTTMLRRAMMSSRLAAPVECSARTIRPAFASYRNVSSAARLPTLTASETRRRPSVRPHQQPASQGGVNGLSPTSKRTIFIQTENTPNPDVSSGIRLGLIRETPLTFYFLKLGLEVYPQPPRSARGLPQHIPRVHVTAINSRATAPFPSRCQTARC